MLTHPGDVPSGFAAGHVGCPLLTTHPHFWPTPAVVGKANINMACFCVHFSKHECHVACQSCLAKPSIFTEAVFVGASTVLDLECVDTENYRCQQGSFPVTDLAGVWDVQ